MNSRNWRKPLSVFLIVLVLVLVTTAVSAAQPLPEAVSSTVSVPDFEIIKDASGYDLFEIDGYYKSALPGDPLLPVRQIDIALPPDVIPATVQVSVTDMAADEQPGRYNIAPAPPYATWVDGQLVEDWGPNAAAIVDGKNSAVYGHDRFFPAQPVELSAFSQMRKFRFARVTITPVAVNPVSGQVRFISDITFELQFERQSLLSIQKERLQMELSDTVMDPRASEMFANPSQAESWYAQEGLDAAESAEMKTGYVIVTTNKIVERSLKLDDFVAHKAALGFEVHVVTENQYGTLTGQPPNGDAEKIREWLKVNYLALNIEYVLLVGNPDPDHPDQNDSVGDIPMKIVYADGRPGIFNDINKSIPTDYFYADLTGNWDLNGDLHFGDVPDRDPGGMDLTAEVFVGRIPVYRGISGWRAELDSILQKIMDYETSLDVSWRRSVLLPMTFWNTSHDTGHLAELMKADYLTERGISSHTMYEQGARGPQYDSVHESDEALAWPAVRDHWQDNPYGAVAWATHGSPTSAAIVFNSWEAVYLQDSRPALTFQSSCSTGMPERSDNLGYALLKNGAVGTVSASRYSWLYVNYTAPDPNNGSNAAHTYYYIDRLTKNLPSGEALYTTKGQFYGFWWLENRMAYNLYGDPSLALNLDNEPPTQTIQISANREHNVDGMSYARGDILGEESAIWEMIFDASVQTITTRTDLHAFTFLDDGSILMVFDRSVNLPGLSTKATPWDIVKFTPDQPGDYSAGTFSLHFDGSDVGLANSGEKIDALDEVDGKLYLSVNGRFTVMQDGKKLVAQDEDVLEFTPASTGSDTSGTWSLVFDGSKVPGLGVEDIGSLTIRSLAENDVSIYISLYNGFNIAGVAGNQKDILHLYSCSADGSFCAEHFWRGPANGFLSAVDGSHIVFADR